MSYIQSVQRVITVLLVLSFGTAFACLGVIAMNQDPDSHLGVHSPNWEP